MGFPWGTFEAFDGGCDSGCFGLEAVGFGCHGAGGIHLCAESFVGSMDFFSSYRNRVWI